MPVYVLLNPGDETNGSDATARDQEILLYKSVFDLSTTVDYAEQVLSRSGLF